MQLRERIAFAMWKSPYPEHMRDNIKPSALGDVMTPLGDGWTISHDLNLDWDLNRDSYLQLADIAIAEMEREHA